MKRILFIGDIVGRPGREFIVKHLNEFREEFKLDLVVANGENSAAGSGITRAIVEELTTAGVDGITLGDHAWDQSGFVREINNIDKVSRPANLPPSCPGKRHLILETKDFRLGVITVLGRVFMKIRADCPFRCVEDYLTQIKGQVDSVLVEVHAEATSEKVAMGRYLDGRVGLVVGTHTHIPTADGCILKKGTAYLTDAGMTGPYDSVLGTDGDIIVAQYLDGMPRRYNIASGDVRMCGCIVTLDEGSGLAVDFEPICVTEAE